MFPFRVGRCAGYIIVDPKTGDGGYYISGGSNGGFLLIGAGVALSLVAIGAGIFASELLLFGNISVVIGLLMLAAAAFVAAGVALLLGDRVVGCMLAYSLGVAWLTALINVTGLIGMGLRVLGLAGIPATAREACYCDVGEPCLP